MSERTRTEELPDGEIDDALLDKIWADVSAAQGTKYSEDQPRDESGRFTDGGGTAEEPLKWSDDGMTIDGLPGDPERAGLTEDEAWAVDYYVEGGNSFMNAHLREGKGPTFASQHKVIDEYVPAMDAAIAKNSFDKQTTLYRGFGAKDVPKAGETFRDKGFVSTSTSKGETEIFGPIQVTIRVPAGTHYVEGEGLEKEIILPRGSTFRVLDATLGPPIEWQPGETSPTGTMWIELVDDTF